MENKLGDKYTILRIELNRCTKSDFIKQLDALIGSTPDLASIFVTTSKAHDIAKYLEAKKIQNIKLIGYDLISENLHYLNNGLISFLINQNPKGQGYWGIYHLVDFLVLKKTVPALKYLPLDIVTKENLNYYIEEENHSCPDIN